MIAYRDRLIGFLRRNNVPFATRMHPEAFTARDVANVLKIPMEHVAKVVIVFADGKNVMLVLPADHQVDFEKLKTVLEATEVRLAEEREFEDLFLDSDVGAMPPFGNLYNMPVYVDSSLTRDEQIVFNACTHTETVAMSYKDYERLAHPVVAEFAHETKALERV